MKTRVFILAAMTAFVAVLTAPAAASAVLTNDYGQTFAGQASCVQQKCHDTYGYGRTTHSEFAKPGAGEPATTAPGMWPAGRPGVGLIAQASDIVLSLGGNTGLREYLWFTPADSATAVGPVQVANGLEWDPSGPTIWELATTGITKGEYTCAQCHHLGVQYRDKKPVAGHGSAAATPTRNAWALDAADDRAVKETWVKGASIQCERCHGTGLADSGTDGHWTSGVQIVGGWSSTPYGQKVSQGILDSQVCGQCHGTFKSGNVLGYTPDTTLTSYVTPFGFDAIPDETAFEASSGLAAAARFFPSGQNKAMKHSYYSEWTLSAHSLRGALTSASPGASMYQKAGNGHFSMSIASIGCIRCHTGEGYLKRKGAWVMSDWVESTATAGQYGQECAVCHYSHKSDGTGLSIREPDAAGVGSAAGLSVGNQSMCEDCHNWQNEIMGTALVPTVVGEPVRHPQRELLHGRGMFDVPAAGQFMPDVKCEECHMPATKSDFPPGIERFANQSWKRYSHSMKVMEPGDAKDWGLAPWGDSCSPCHPSVPQDELQTSLDEWQADAAEAAALATAAIEAAQARPGSTTPDAAELLGRAYVNTRMYVNDLSGGVHNPPYILAGLSKAEQMARSVGGSFKIIASPSAPMAVGGIGAVAGMLEFGDDTAAAGQPVVLESLAGSVWSVAGSTSTDAYGNFAFMVSPPATTTYRVRWDRSSAAVTRLYTSPFAVTVTGPPPGTTATTITIRTSATSIKLGGTFNLSGVVTPPSVAGRTMHADVMKPGKSYWSYSSARVIAGGTTATWWYRYKPLYKGTYKFKGVFDGGSGYGPSTSGIVSVSVK